MGTIKEDAAKMQRELDENRNAYFEGRCTYDEYVGAKDRIMYENFSKNLMHIMKYTEEEANYVSLNEWWERHI